MGLRISDVVWLIVLVVGACLGVVAAPDLVWNGLDLLALALVGVAWSALRGVTR